MFGIGKLLGNVVGGLLDKIGLGKIAPFVKLGLDAMTGNWLGVAEDVFGMVSKFKGDFLDKAATRPPLGNFENTAQQLTSGRKALSGNRLSGLLKGLGNLFKGFKALQGGGNPLSSFGKIFNAFKTINDSFDNNRLFSDRSDFSQYTSIQA